MMKILRSSDLKNKFSASNLNSRVGQVNFRSDKNDKIKTGVYRGVGLKKVMVGIGAGKSKGLFEKELKKYGIADSQINKRRAIIDLAFGDKDKSPAKPVKASDGKTFLSEEQKERNLKRARRTRAGESGAISRGETARKYGAREVTSYGIVRSNGIRGRVGMAKDLGVEVKTGFAGDYKKANLPDTSAPKASPAGTRPLGL